MSLLHIPTNNWTLAVSPTHHKYTVHITYMQTHSSGYKIKWQKKLHFAEPMEFK